MSILTQERLKEVVAYNPETGLFTWKFSLSRRVRIGEPAGCIRDRYVTIVIDGHAYQAHNLAWLYIHGYLPEKLDHRDTNGYNNAIDNLRLATNSENNANRRLRLDNRLGAKGVHSHKQRFRAQITVDHKKIHLGLFETKEEASTAYAEAAEKYFGDFARVA